MFVYDYQGQAGNEFRVYFHQQASQNLYGGLAPCNDTTSRPEIDGITCPLSGTAPPPPPNPSVVSISPPSPTFVGSVGGSRPTSIAVNVSVSNGSSWSSQDTCSFFDAAPTSGPAGGSHTLTPSAGWDLLPAGSYQCPITYSASGNSDLTVLVTAVKEAMSSPPAAPTNLRVE